jgi:hypothetical protein
MQSNNTTNAETEHPEIASFTDLVPSFPLDKGEILVTSDSDGNPKHVLIPSSISPARCNAERNNFFVEFLAFEVLEHDEHGRYVTPPSSLYESSDNISNFEKLVDAGTVITRDDMKVVPNVPEDAKTPA